MKWDRSKGAPEPIRLLNRVTEKENNDPLVDIRTACPAAVIARPTVIPLVRTGVAERVNKATKCLPKGVFLGITDAFRPFDRQKLIYEMMWNFGVEAFPHLDYKQMRRKINRWVAPIDQKAPPGHCTGAAIDVNLLDAKGEPIDVWSPLDRFSAAPTFTIGLSVTANRNRMILYEAMVGAGFSNCRDEWWHYSYGDAGWAVRIGETECFYGLVEIDVASYKEADGLWLKALRERENPFLSLPGKKKSAL